MTAARDDRPRHPGTSRRRAADDAQGLGSRSRPEPDGYETSAPIAGSGSYDPSAYDTSSRDSDPYDSSPYDSRPYDSSPYDSRPYGAEQSGNGAYGQSSAGPSADSYTYRSGSYGSGGSVFDIADDRRDEGTAMSYPTTAGGARGPIWGPSADPGHTPTTAMAVPGNAYPYPVAPPPPPATAVAPPPTPDGLNGAGLPTPRESSGSGDAEELVAIIRSSFTAVSPRADELTQLFYGWLFRIAPETRELFPVTMELQRTRLLRALVHVVQMVDRPDELTTFLRQLGRDHRKFGVVGEHYDKVGEALLGALGEIAGPLWTHEVENAWTTAYGIVAQAMRDAADAERGPAVWMARVMEHRRVSQDLAIVRVQTSQPVPYLAGQYVSVETPQRPRMWRSMSPANAPGPDCVMEFHVRTVPGGWVSRAIVSHARVGDVWRVGPPMGQMTLDPRSRSDLLMVAGGTGLAPARAIIEQLTNEGTDRKVALFVGGRRWEDLYDIERLRRAAQEYPWLTVVPVIEEDGRPYGAETGTVGEVVARYGAWADRETVLAGSPPMVRATVSAMLEAGTPFMRIHYDPYHTD